MKIKYGITFENATPLNMSFMNKLQFVIIFLLVLQVTICLGQSLLTVKQLINDLGCPACHSGFTMETDIRNKPPDLSHAGLQFNPAYLFEFLQNPTNFRRNIGNSRMPNFNLSQKETLALVLFLETQVYINKKWPEFPSDLTRLKHTDLEYYSSTEMLAIFKDTLQCIKCHALKEEGINESTELTSVGYRLNREWLKTFMAAPKIFDWFKTTCPSYFYSLISKQTEFTEILPKAAQILSDMVNYLFLLPEDKTSQIQTAFEKAKKAYPDINADMGKKIFMSLNCVACHQHASIKPWQKYIAPDLSIEGERVNKDWLETFLKHPKSVRPFGFYPGSGSRMPDFRLTNEEVNLLTDYLLNQKSLKIANKGTFEVKELSAFLMDKAKKLLQTKLSCLGCHQLGNEGGKIAPSFANLKSRLQVSFVYNFVQDPKEILPETIMPKVSMPQKTSELIVNYLLQQENSTSDSMYLSLTDTPVHYYRGPEQGLSLYIKNCAPCHGTKGDGKGYNAKYLPTEPTNHSDKIYMSNRPDDTLYDGIFAGGYILNKSHFMPPWGYTINHSEIRQLVADLRQLCQCEGPLWSRDNKQ